MSLDAAIIIVNFNTFEYTAQCVRSVLSAPPAHAVEIVLVDNGSADNSADQLAAAFPDIRLLRSRTNLGFAGGNNLAIQQTDSRYVLLVNSDTLVTPGSIDRVITFADAHPDAACVGGQLLHEDRRFQSSHIGFPSLWQEFLIFSQLGMRFIRRNFPSAAPGTEVAHVDWMSGAFLLLRRSALDAVGLMDESYFMYSEEADLQYRFHKAGWRRYYLPDVQTVHFGGKSSAHGQRRYLIYRGYLMFFQKHYGRVATAALRAMFAAFTGSKIAWGSVRRWLAHSAESDDMESYRQIFRLCFQADLTQHAL